MHVSEIQLKSDMDQCEVENMDVYRNHVQASGLTKWERKNPLCDHGGVGPSIQFHILGLTKMINMWLSIHTYHHYGVLLTT